MLVRGYGHYPFPTATLRPGEVNIVALDFQIPFELETFVASPDNSEGLVVEDILVGDRSLVTPGCALPMELFYEGRMPICFSKDDVPVGSVLRMRVRNTSSEYRTLRASVFGHGVVDAEPPLNKLQCRESRVWRFLVVPALRLLHSAKNVLKKQRGGR